MTSKEPTIESCLSTAEIADLRLRPTQAFIAHVESCRRCRGVIRLLDERDGVDSEMSHTMPRFAAIPRRESPENWTFGETIYIASPDAVGTQLVAILIGDEGDEPSLKVAPISTEIANATDEDLLLESSDSPLGYPAMVEVWNYGVALKEQVVGRAGVLEDGVLNDLREILSSMHGDERVRLDPPADTGEPSTERTAIGDRRAERRGVPILSENDPRVVFQDEESLRVRPFWLPSARFFAGTEPSNLGALLDEWLNHERVSDVEYADQIGVSLEMVRSVRGGNFSDDAVSHERLAEIFAPTSVPVDRAVVALSDYLARPRPARFRSGQGSSRSGVIYELPESLVAGRATTPRARRQPDAFARDYVARFKEALERMRESGLS